MDAPVFMAYRHLLGLSTTQLARILDVDPRTLRAWEKARSRIPDGIACELLELARDHGRIAQRFISCDAVVTMPREDGEEFPRNYYVAALARALEAEPGIRAEWTTPTVMDLRKPR